MTGHGTQGSGLVNKVSVTQKLGSTLEVSSKLNDSMKHISYKTTYNLCTSAKTRSRLQDANHFVIDTKR